MFESVLGTFGGWFVIAIAAVALLYVVLRIVGKAIATSVRVAIVLGSLVVITIALFVLSALSYFVDYFEVHEILKWFLVSVFGLMKAGLIISYFMHMRFERLSLIYTILLPPLLLLALLGILAAEGDYIYWVRQLLGW